MVIVASLRPVRRSISCLQHLTRVGKGIGAEGHKFCHEGILLVGRDVEACHLRPLRRVEDYRRL